MAHELAHVRHRDILISTVSATMVGAIFDARQLRDVLRRPATARAARTIPIVGLLVMILAPLAASLIQMAISRAREFEADRGGAEISGDPRALASALQKIQRFAQGLPMAPAERHPETAQMMIINPLSRAGCAACSRPTRRPRSASSACWRWPPERQRAGAGGLKSGRAATITTHRCRRRAAVSSALPSPCRCCCRSSAADAGHRVAGAHRRGQGGRGGKAVGSACRHANRALEDRYLLNPKVAKAAVFCRLARDGRIHARVTDRGRCPRWRNPGHGPTPRPPTPARRPRAPPRAARRTNPEPAPGHGS